MPTAEAAPRPKPAEPMTPGPARVRRVRRETYDTFSLDVGGVEGPLPPFQPGQFSMLYVFGVGELPISISGDASEGVHTYTVRAVGAATSSLVGRAPGEWLGVRGPFGVGWPVEAARGRDVILVAGGIGLAPLRPVVRSVLRRRKDFGRLVVLYGARSPRDLLFRGELTRWGREPDTQVIVTVDYGGLDWRGNVGVVTTLFPRVRLDPARSVAMVCGPEIMMRYVAMELAQRGVPAESVFLSMERNMKCGIGWCGHCQLGPAFVCRDGPVFPWTRLQSWMRRHEA